MAVSDVFAKNGLLVAVIGVLGVYIVLQYDSTLFGLLGSSRGMEGFKSSGAMMKQKRKEGFADAPITKESCEKDPKKMFSNGKCLDKVPTDENSEIVASKKAEGFADLASMEGPAAFGSAEAPAGCYPRAQLTPVQLLPADQDSIYAQQNPMGVGSLKGKNFLSAGALIGVNTVGQSMRNANLQVRSEPPNPQVAVSIFNQSTISPDISHRPLEIGA
jgi:hypothetical protein